MLVLSRKMGEGVWIGDDVRIQVTGRHGDKIRLGIQAPPDVKVLRAELVPGLVAPTQPVKPPSQKS